MAIKRSVPAGRAAAGRLRGWSRLQTAHSGHARLVAERPSAAGARRAQRRGRRADRSRLVVAVQRRRTDPAGQSASRNKIWMCGSPRSGWRNRARNGRRGGAVVPHAGRQRVATRGKSQAPRASSAPSAPPAASGFASGAGAGASAGGSGSSAGPGGIGGVSIAPLDLYQVGIRCVMGT